MPKKRSSSVVRMRRVNEEKRNIKMVAPLATWSVDTLMKVASDRGYRSESAVAYAVSNALRIQLRSAKMLIHSGRMTWGQVLLIGDCFDMTPKEFCDTFLHGYFKETSTGTFRAQIDDPAAYLQKPIKVTPLDGEQDVNNSER